MRGVEILIRNENMTSEEHTGGAQNKKTFEVILYVPCESKNVSLFDGL